MVDEGRVAANADAFDGHRRRRRWTRAIARRIRQFDGHAPLRHSGESESLAKDLLSGRPTAGERRASWAIWLSILGLIVLALAAWPWIRSVWD